MRNAILTLKRSPQELAVALKQAIYTYKTRTESRTFKEEILLRDKALALAAEASEVLEVSVVAEARLLQCVDNYEQARQAVTEATALYKQDPSKENEEKKVEACKRLASILQVLAEKAAFSFHPFL